MVDFWINVALTLGVTFALLLVDWLANRVISSGKQLATIERRVNELVSSNATKRTIQEEVTSLAKTNEPIVWGNDLASIAFSIDLGILGVYITDPTKFPFFSNWNVGASNYELPIWLVVIFIHLALLFFSIFLKHSHTGRIESFGANQVLFLRKGWLSQNSYLIGSNVVGFISLLSAFSIISNSLPII